MRDWKHKNPAAADGGRVREPAAHPVDLFIDLRDQVLLALDESRREVERQLRRPATVASAHYVLVALGVYLLGLVILLPIFNTLIDVVVKQSPNTFLSQLLAEASWGPSLLAVLIWTLAVAPISAMVYLWSKPHRALILFPYTLFICPQFLVLGLVLLEYWRVGIFPTSQVIRLAILAFLLSFALLGFLVYPISIMFSGSIPRTLFLLRTSMVGGRSSGLFPSYEELVKRAVEQTASTVAQHTVTHLRQIESIAQSKQSGLNGRLQSLSLAVGSIALLSLLTLALAYDQISGALNALLSFVTSITNTSRNLTGTGVNGSYIFALFLLILVLLALRYFSAAYRELRLMELMNAICGMKLAEEVSTVASPLPTTPMAATSASSQPITSIATLLSLLAIVIYFFDRLFSRLSNRTKIK